MDPVEPLILDLLEDLRAGAKPVSAVLEAWRTSCPRLPVWEEAVDRGLLERYRDAGTPGEWVRLSPAGRAWLAAQRPRTATPA